MSRLTSPPSVRAVLDALCRGLNRSFYDVVRANLAGIDPTALCPDLAGFDLPAFLAGLRPAGRIAARHTVGLVDPITGQGASTSLHRDRRMIMARPD